jgi:cobalt/nickel transport system ATP-binding protein
MVLDEPTTGLDPKGVDEVMEILQMLNKEDMSIIIASHDVEMVTEFADRIFVLHDGEIIGQGTTEEIFNDPITLKKAHLKPPKAAELLHLLKKGGIPVNIQLTVSGAYHEILHVLGVKSYHNLLHVVKNDLHHQLLHNLGETKYHEMLHIIEENQHSFELN